MMVASISYAISKRFKKHSLDVKGLVKKGNVFTINKDTNILWTLNVDTIIHTDYLTLNPHDNLEKLKSLIRKSDQTIFAVTIDDKLIGTVYFNDVREIIFSDVEMQIKDLISARAEIIHQFDSMEIVMNKFKNSNKAYLPVLKGGNYYGFVNYIIIRFCISQKQYFETLPT